jgi:hypothetical protein
VLQQLFDSLVFIGNRAIMLLALERERHIDGLRTNDGDGGAVELGVDMSVLELGQRSDSCTRWHRVQATCTVCTAVTISQA